MALRLIINRLPSPLPSFFIYGGTRSTFLLKLSALLLDRNRFFHFLFSFFLWGPTGQRSRLCFYDFMSTLWQFCIMSLYLQIGSVFLGFKEFRPMKDFQLKWSLEMERETIFYKKMSTQKGRWWPVLPFGGGAETSSAGSSSSSSFTSAGSSSVSSSSSSSSASSSSISSSKRVVDVEEFFENERQWAANYAAHLKSVLAAIAAVVQCRQSTSSTSPTSFSFTRT